MLHRDVWSEEDMQARKVNRVRTHMGSGQRTRKGSYLEISCVFEMGSILRSMPTHDPINLTSSWSIHGAGYEISSPRPAPKSLHRNGKIKKLLLSRADRYDHHSRGKVSMQRMSKRVTTGRLTGGSNQQQYMGQISCRGSSMTGSVEHKA